MTICLFCGEETSAPKFCNNSCSAKYNNSRRKPRSAESREKTSKSVKTFIDNLSDREYFDYIKSTHRNKDVSESVIRNRFLPKQEIVGECTRVFFRICKISGRRFVSLTPKQIHPELKEKRKEYGYSCAFRFSISQFPLWFTGASELIKNLGWYSTPGSRSGISNTNGVSRDHLYSVSDGWANNIPPNLIRHPANCALVPHKENQKKSKKSSITIDELLVRIKEFEKLYGYPVR